MFFGNVVGIKVKREWKFSVRNWKHMNMCFLFASLFINLTIFFLILFLLSHSFSKKVFSQNSEFVAPKFFALFSHRSLSTALKKTAWKNSFPASFFVMATWQLILFRVQEGVPRRGGLGPRHSMRLRPPPLPLLYWCRFVRA